MNTYTTGQARDYAARLGLLAGAVWVASFYCCIYGLNGSWLGSLGLWLGMASPFIVGMRLQGLRRAGIDMPFRRLWYTAWLTFLYATLLMAVGQHIYFRYLDGGRLLAIYSEFLAQPEYLQLLGRMLPEQDPAKVAEEFVASLSVITPMEMTITFFIYNLFLSVILAPLAALMGRMGQKGTGQNPS